MKPSSNYTAIVGMSGGVDSSVAALLLQQQGLRICGAFMRNWEADADDPYCQANMDLTDAKAVCDKLGIELKTVNFAEEYWQKVFQHFLDEYSRGRTPNPDVLCNQEIKFQAFLNYALKQGAEKIATGHYAQIRATAHGYELIKAQDTHKDQTYFLYRLNQQQLAHSTFPLGKLTKPQVRRLAQQAGFVNYAKKDSTGICFIGERKFKHFLNEYLLAEPGNIETPEGKILGRHEGLMFYTIGQRQGLGIGGIKDTTDAPWYVLEKSLSRNVLIVGQGHDHPLLYKTGLTCQRINWLAGHPPPLPLDCSAKIRYRQEEQFCQVDALNENTLQVNFARPQRAITPGQSVVFYQNEICLGGGIIE